MVLDFVKAGGRRALTLVELTLALALAATVVVIGVRAYSVAMENERVRQSISLVGFARDSINSRYGMQSNYQGLSNDLVVSAFPQGLVQTGNKILDPFGGHLEIGPDTMSKAGDSNYISLSNLTTDACKKLSRADMGRDAAYISVTTDGGGPVNKAMALPLSDSDAATVETQCKAASRVSVSWQFVPGASAAIIKTLQVVDQTTLQTALSNGVPGTGNWTGDPFNFHYVSDWSGALLTDVWGYNKPFHPGWADPANGPGDAKQMMENAINAMSGNLAHCNCYTPTDISLAVAYMQYVAIPARTGGDADKTAAMMAAITSYANQMFTTGQTKKYPGF